MIVVRHSVAVEEPVTRVGYLWADFVRRRLAEQGFVPDEWLHAGDPGDAAGSGDVHFEADGAARTTVTLTLRLDLPPSDARTGPAVEAAYHRAVAHLNAFGEFAVAGVR